MRKSSILDQKLSERKSTRGKKVMNQILKEQFSKEKEKEKLELMKEQYSFMQDLWEYQKLYTQAKLDLEFQHEFENRKLEQEAARKRFLD